MKKSTKKQLQLAFIYSCIDNMSAGNWGDCSADETLKKIAMIHTYNCCDLISWEFGSKESEYMSELSDKYKLMDFIFRNIRYFNTSVSHQIQSEYDCSGECHSESLTVRKLDEWSLIIIKSASFDY